MWSLRWISLCSLLFALGAHVEATNAQAPVDPRAIVAVRLTIDAESFKLRLRDDELPKVAATMEQALRRTMAQYGFLNWNVPTGLSVYTISVRVTQASTKPSHVYLEVAILGPDGKPTKSVSFLFERFGERRNWNPDVVAEECARRAETVLYDQRARLISELLGQLPLQAGVTLYPREAQANVRLRPDEIGAARGQAPRFRVMATIVDPGPPLETEGAAELLLGGCVYQRVNRTYVCDIEGITYRGRTSLVAGQQDLMRRVRISVQSLHVYEYWPDNLERGVVAKVGGT